MITSRNVPGYEVDSLTIKVPFEMKGANSAAALRNKEISGSRLSPNGVGTHIVTTDACATDANSVEALYAPFVIAI
jgi:hypothetical protein